jgi:hypothetical protein
VGILLHKEWNGWYGFGTAPLERDITTATVEERAESPICCGIP